MMMIDIGPSNKSSMCRQIPSPKHVPSNPFSKDVIVHVMICQEFQLSAQSKNKYPNVSCLAASFM
ncbi:hypothetical protein HanXRQr2_Chr09g0411301 [Helianthus annuus]|uniref:Uncharacterized protein n=1 Tax=Helianthus annuus TaxID=4232 RepID=A0A9K3NB08_HELAN|nr:hypothetical protein HanXRQr2_Chr09g0411301 [Helianthus annuus]